MGLLSCQGGEFATKGANQKVGLVHVLPPVDLKIDVTATKRVDADDVNGKSTEIHGGRLRGISVDHFCRFTAPQKEMVVGAVDLLVCTTTGLDMR